MRRRRNIVGSEVTSTSVQPPDEGPPVEADGLAALVTPEKAGIDEDVEDDDAFQALLEDLSPGEAQDVLETMRPLSEDEEKILDEVPGLANMRKVDDPAEEEWLQDLTKGGYRSMDKVLDDAIFGDTMDHDEQLERMGRDADADVGFSIPGLSAIKKIATAPMSLASKAVSKLPGGKYISRAATAPMSAAQWAARKVGSTLKRFVPSRDAGKAKMMQNLMGKLTVEHANWLGIQDQQAGRPLLSPLQYRSMSQSWAKQKIAAAGLPTTLSGSRADELAGDIIGEDFVGSWWNPLSWFQTQTQVVINQTQGERSPVGPDGQPLAAPPDQQYDPSQDPYAQDPNAQYAQDPYAQDPSAQYAQDPYAQADYSQGMAGISGEDSLGALSTEILAGAAPKEASGKKDDQMISIAVVKLRSGQPLRPGELAIVARLAKSGHPRAKKLYDLLSKEGTSKISGEGESGAWLHKLSPSYWFKSSEEKRLIDKERQAWIDNAELQKKLGKQAKVLEQAEKAKTATEAVEAAKKQAEATEAQLKAIEASIKGYVGGCTKSDASGSFVGSFVGHEKPTTISKVISAALAKEGMQDRAAGLYDKVARGEALSGKDLEDAKKVARILHKIKVVHGDLYTGKPAEVPYELTALHGAFVGACLAGVARSARKKCATCGRAAEVIARKPTAKSVSALCGQTKKLQDLSREFASGKLLCGLSSADKLRRTIVGAAAKASMTDAEKKMVSAIAKLAKAGNPRAIEGLKRLQQSGAVMGGDYVGSFISDTFKYATAPIWLPAKHLYQGAKWTGQKLGIISKGGGSPEDVRIQRMRAAAQRRKAAEARARAADAQSMAELRAQQSIADAADAEADAADAEATSKEAAMRTREIEADPSQAEAADEDSSGAFVGGWEAHVEAGRDAAFVGKAKEDSAAGKKVRAGAKFYSKVKAGDPKAKAALKSMIARSQKGDAQATSDLRAVYAGRGAVLAREKAKKKQVRVLAKKAKAAKVRAFQAKVEAAAANKIVRFERKRELRKLSVVERKAARNDKKAKAYVAAQVAAAKRGDRKAANKVGKLKLVRSVRLAAPNRREKRNLAQASRLVARAKRNDPKAIRQIGVIDAAAKSGNPNAKRARKRLEIAAAVAATVATGTAVAAGAKKQADKKAKQSEVDRARAKMRAGTASREELAAGARAAKAVGDQAAVAELSVAAARAPSSTESLQKTASVIAARDAGSEEAKAAVESQLEKARTGDVDAIRKTGDVVAAQTIADLQAGRPVSPAVRDAVNIQERAAAGDQGAIQQVKDVTEAATGPSPAAEATAAAVTLAAAAATAKAMASKPKAREEFLQKVNAMPAEERPEAEKELASYVQKAKEGSITPEEGVAAERIAERLGKPKVAAQIAALAPPPPPPTPLSSLPDMPQPPITGPLSFAREVVRALTFSTRDPLANYREGIQSRSVESTVSSGDSAGWSPFTSFVRNLPIVAPATALAASATSLVTSLQARKSAGRQAAPAAPPAPAAPQAPAAPAAPAATVKKISAERAPVEEEAAPASSSGADKTFRDYVAEALAAKKISRKDFNRAVEAQTGASATTQTKVAVGQKVLEFFANKGVKVEA